MATNSRQIKASLPQTVSCKFKIREKKKENKFGEKSQVIWSILYREMRFPLLERKLEGA